MFKKYRKASFMPMMFAFCWLAFAVFGFSWDLCRILEYKTYLRSLASITSLSMTNQCYYIKTTGSYDVNAQNVVVVPERGLPESEAFGQTALIGSTGTGVNVQTQSIYTDYETNQKDVRNGQVKYAGMKYLFNELIPMQPGNIVVYEGVDENLIHFEPDCDFMLVKNKCMVNKSYFDMSSEEQKSYDYIMRGDSEQSFNRYIHGRDKYNGEVEVDLTAVVKLMFMRGNLFNTASQDYVTIREQAISQPRILQYDTSTTTPNTNVHSGTLNDIDADVPLNLEKN